uniref:SMP-30/Gluconolactonase/LRE-like region domain-containing protein n=1 Tax=Schlesneria paludicola TaxID=360056 RepID=A0A7C2JYI1_9PLAN
MSDSSWSFVSALIALAQLATSAGLAADPAPQYPLAIAVAPEGAVYLADRNLPGVWKITDDKLTLFHQASKKFRTPLNAIRCLAIDKEGRLLAGDSATRDVYRFNADGQPEPLTKGGIGIPMAIAVDAQGDIFVADLELHRIVKVPAAGGEPTVAVAVPAPRGLTIDAEQRLWVVSHGPDQLLRVSPDGQTRDVIVTGRPFSFPHHLVLDGDGAAFVVDGYLPGVWKVPPGQMPEKWQSGDPFRNPVGIARAGDKLLVVDPRAQTLFTLDAAGKVVGTRSLTPMP